MSLYNIHPLFWKEDSSCGHNESEADTDLNSWHITQYFTEENELVLCLSTYMRVFLFFSFLLSAWN